MCIHKKEKEKKKQLLFRCSLPSYASEHQRLVNKLEWSQRVNSIFQQHLIPTLATPPGKQWARFPVNTELMIRHWDCITQAQWLTLTNTHDLWLQMHMHTHTLLIVTGLLYCALFQIKQEVLVPIHNSWKVLLDLRLLERCLLVSWACVPLYPLVYFKK